jgi:multiple sugar transport system substrate-binding protein
MTGSRDGRSARALLAAVATSCLLVLAGCGGDDDEGGAAGGGGGGGGGASETAAAECKKSTGNVNLDFWSWVPGVEKAVEKWNADNPNIQVKVKETPAGNAGTYQNMFNALKAGNAPDLAQIEFDSLPSFRLQDGLTDIAPCGAGDAQGQFIDWTWQQVSFGEEAAYAVPQDTGPMAMYYRKDLFEKYGIEVPKTWEEYAAARGRSRRRTRTPSSPTSPSATRTGSRAWPGRRAPAGSAWTATPGTSRSTTSRPRRWPTTGRASSTTSSSPTSRASRSSGTRPWPTARS